MAKEADEVLSELREIKMLMILQLLRQGVKQNLIASMLGISESTMSRMLPKGIAKSLAKSGTISFAEETE